MMAPVNLEKTHALTVQRVEERTSFVRPLPDNDAPSVLNEPQGCRLQHPTACRWFHNLAPSQLASDGAPRRDRDLGR